MRLVAALAGISLLVGCTYSDHVTARGKISLDGGEYGVELAERRSGLGRVVSRNVSLRQPAPNDLYRFDSFIAGVDTTPNDGTLTFDEFFSSAYRCSTIPGTPWGECTSAQMDSMEEKLREGLKTFCGTIGYDRCETLGFPTTR